MSSKYQPFADVNANTLTNQNIIDYYSEPYSLFNINVDDLKYGKNAIIFEGARGTGKTMLFRHFSYDVQQLMVYQGKTFYQKLLDDRFFGIYVRVDTALLYSLGKFQMDGVNDPDYAAELIYSHFFELTVFGEYLSLVKTILKDVAIVQTDSIYKEIVTDLALMLGLSKNDVKSIEDLIIFVKNEINLIASYNSKKQLDVRNSVKFSPHKMFLFGNLSNEFCKSVFVKYFKLTTTNIIVFIDEFENYTIPQQKVINKAMRSSKEYGIRLRIGMRPFGLKTSATLTDEDFVKEGREYVRVVFDTLAINRKEYLNLLEKVAQKRLNALPLYSGRNIREFLGEEENLEQEAIDIVNNKTIHIEFYLKLINQRNNYREPLTLSSIKELRSENPLYEMENLRLLLQGAKLEDVIKAFKDYTSGNFTTVYGKKYRNDYDKKYKLSFVFVLCSIYKKERKHYYGLIDYCYLSSGVIRNFVSLCSFLFGIAEFKNPAALVQGKALSRELQTEAAFVCASHEYMNEIEKITPYGDELKLFIRNLGNAFAVIHKDPYIRYPETNQFSLPPTLKGKYLSIIKTACTWALLMRKSNLQDLHGGSNRREIFVLNRVFSPLFKISYRTRGGINPMHINEDYFSPEFDANKVISEHSQSTSRNIWNIDDDDDENDKEINNQLTLFDLLH